MHDSSEEDQEDEDLTSGLVHMQSYDEPAREMDSGGTLQMQERLSLGTVPGGPGSSGSSADFVTVPVEMPRPIADHLARGGTMLCHAAGKGVLLARTDSVASLPRGDARDCSKGGDGSPRCAGAQSMPVRRRARKSRHGASSTRDLLRKRSRDEDSPTTRNGRIPQASEETWEHRIRKRVVCVERIKAQPEFRYSEVVERRQQVQKSHSSPSLLPSPRTPDPNDRSVSKRGWEEAIIAWKDALRSCHDGPREPAEQLDPEGQCEPEEQSEPEQP